MKQSASSQPSAGGWVVLGLLMDSPRSGYDLAALAQRTVGKFWPVTKAHVYAELPRLERLGYARGRDVPQKGVPDKRVFSATAQGRTAFSEWLAAATLGDPLLRHPMLLRVFFGNHLSLDGLSALAETFGAQVKNQRRHYQALLDVAAPQHSQAQASRETAEMKLRRLAIRHAILRLDAELRWLEELKGALKAVDDAPASPAKHRAIRRAPKTR